MPSYHVTTFGCQMNEHDSERMKGMLESLGYDEAAARENADLILFNTCSIREKADSRFVSHLYDARAISCDSSTVWSSSIAPGSTITRISRPACIA